VQKFEGTLPTTILLATIPRILTSCGSLEFSCFHIVTPVNQATAGAFGTWRSPETVRRPVGVAITPGSQCRSYTNSLPRWLNETALRAVGPRANVAPINAG
jgi:hypothetical protein